MGESTEDKMKCIACSKIAPIFRQNGRRQYKDLWERDPRPTKKRFWNARKVNGLDTIPNKYGGALGWREGQARLNSHEQPTDF